MIVPPQVGVGVVYTAAIEPFLGSCLHMIDSIEVEPQTMWLSEHPINGPFTVYEPAFERFQRYLKRSLVHSVGMPLGGSRPPHPHHLDTLKAFADRLNPPWVSEHLSIAGTPHQSAGFLLPPLQTNEGVKTASHNIQMLSNVLERPVAVETGVSYIKKKRYEMDDGEFLAKIVDLTDCGILLDINNIYCNIKNGRINLESYLQQIPLQNVWEVHLAGTSEINGFTVDAHNGEMDNAQREIANHVISLLPNLGAITCEIYGAFLENMTQATFERVLTDARDLWDTNTRLYPRSTATHSDGNAKKVTAQIRHIESHETAPSTEQWDRDFTLSVQTGIPTGSLSNDDGTAIQLYTQLASSFRASILTRIMPRAFRYFLLNKTLSITDILIEYFAVCTAQIYGPLEAKQFRHWLKSNVEDDLLHALANYDVAILDAQLLNKNVLVAFDSDPREIFQSLSNFELPTVDDLGTTWEIEITPDAPTSADASQAMTTTHTS